MHAWHKDDSSLHMHDKILMSRRGSRQHAKGILALHGCVDVMSHCLHELSSCRRRGSRGGAGGLPAAGAHAPLAGCRNLTNNNMTGNLQSNWGRTGAFQNLTILDLSNNVVLAGALPPPWGYQVNSVAEQLVHCNH